MSSNLVSGNLLKKQHMALQDSEKRVIDTNELAARRIEALAEKMRQPENSGFVEGLMSAEEDGFVSGLSAGTVEGLLLDSQDGDAGASGSSVIKADRSSAAAQSPQASHAAIQRAKETADQILAEARRQAEEEKESLLAQAREDLERERKEALEHAREQGYEDGQRRAEQELDKARRQLEQERKNMEADYQRLADTLEPRFVDTITDVYEHIFHVELWSYREILVHLISTAMGKAEENRSFLIHVSKDDYPYVSMQKKLLTAGTASANSSVEIIEDVTLSQNECMIETEGGIFDCSLGTQLSELSKRLRLLSYGK